MSTLLNKTILLASASLFLVFPSQAFQPDGQSLYSQHCASCHGEDLEGAIGSSLIDQVWNYGTDPQLIGMNIKFGIPNLEMPGWEGALSDAEIGGLVSFIMKREKEADLTPPPTPKIISTADYSLKVEVLDESLTLPWALDFINNDLALVTDRAGQLYALRNGKLDNAPIEGTPDDIAQRGQAGLFDVVVDPNYDDNGWIYLSYAQGLKPYDDANSAKAMTKIVRGKLDGNRWVNQETLYEADPEFFTTSRAHFGARIVIKGDYLYFSVGDRGAQDQAQDISRPNGNIHRIHKNGSIPEDNPFIGQEGALPTIYSFGHRNPQGLSMHPETGEIWDTEHGPMGGDELNHVRAGKNYGWPTITYGRNYDGSSITDKTEQDGMEQPAKYWVPSIAVFDNDFYKGDMFPKWESNLLVSSLKYRDLRRLVIEGETITQEEVLVKGLGRMRSVKVAPDGSIYGLFNEPSLIVKFSKE